MEKEVAEYVREQQTLDREERVAWRDTQKRRAEDKKMQAQTEVELAKVRAEAGEKRRADEIHKVSLIFLSESIRRRSISFGRDRFQLESILLHPSGRQEIKFCAIKSLILNGYCSNFEYFSLKISHIFLPSLKTLSSKINFSIYLYDN